MEGRETICAVVVTYNRKNLLLECLEALLKQTHLLDAIYIIDNASTDGTPEFLKEKEFIDEIPIVSNKPIQLHKILKNNNIVLDIFYTRMHENTGGAGGFYEGVKRGYEKGFDWLWLMDDDAEPKENALEKLVSCMPTKNNVVALSCLKVSSSGNILFQHRGRINYGNIFKRVLIPINRDDLISDSIQIQFSSFVGLLINTKSIPKIGFPNPNFFIYYDDIDFSIRLSKVGDMYLVSGSVIMHKEMSFEKSRKGRFLWIKSRTQRINIENFWRVYYSVRNKIYLSNLYQKNRINFYLSLMELYLKTTGGIILFDDFKIERIKLLATAFINGFGRKLKKMFLPLIGNRNLEKESNNYGTACLYCNSNI